MHRPQTGLELAAFALAVFLLALLIALLIERRLDGGLERTRRRVQHGDGRRVPPWASVYRATRKRR